MRFGVSARRAGAALGCAAALWCAGDSAARAFDVPIDGLAIPFNALAQKIGTDDRIKFEACLKPDISGPTNCRYQMSRGGSVEALGLPDSPKTKGILVRWTRIPVGMADVTWLEALLLALCSPGSTDTERRDVASKTAAMLEGPHPSKDIVEIVLGGITYSMRSDPQAGFSLYVVDNDQR